MTEHMALAHSCAAAATELREAADGFRCNFMENGRHHLKAALRHVRDAEASLAGVSVYRASVQISVIRDGKLLAVQNRRWGGYSAPGGKVEAGESLEGAARRELLEETGLVPVGDLVRLGGEAHDGEARDEDDKRPWFCMAFVAEIGDQQPHSNERGTGQPYWVAPEELISSGMYPNWYAWLVDLLRLRGYLK